MYIFNNNNKNDTLVGKKPVYKNYGLFSNNDKSFDVQII